MPKKPTVDTMYKPDYQWLGRSLSNYKAMHAQGAAKKGAGAQLEAATTLTQARKIVFGHKRGQKK